jgi:alanine racemase
MESMSEPAATVREEPMPLNWVDIDLAALRHNFYQVAGRMRGHTQILGVVKSDAYGHGMIQVARELAACGAHFLAVSKFWEAQELRAHGIQLPVLTFLGLEPPDMEEAIRLEVRPVIFRLDHARLLSRIASHLQRPVRVHLKVDTGMGRLGVPFEEVSSFLNQLLPLAGVELEGVLSHFAVADEADKAYSQLQIDRFRTVLQMLAEAGRPLAYAHISNSAAILDLPHAHFQLVRPGIMLYGSPPSDEIQYPAELRPVMSFKTRILQLKEVPPNQPIGYGRTYTTDKTSLIATLPVGYDDGYPRILSNLSQVLVRGKRAPLAGRISMSLITIDVTHIPGVQEDDEVVLLGEQGDERISAEEIAELGRTISYEIFCSIGRNRFKYFHNSSLE